MDPQLRKQLQQTVWTAAVTTTRDSRGAASYATAASRLARVETRRQLVTNAQGQQVTSDYWLVCLASVGLLDRVWLPSDNHALASAARKVLKVEECVNELGTVDHYEVWL